MKNKYGCPPSLGDCTPARAPVELVVQLGHSSLDANRSSSQPLMGKKVSAVAIARQLNFVFDFGRKKPVSVDVTGYGTFLIGPSGWELIK